MSLKKYSLALLTGAALLAGLGSAYAVTTTFTATVKYSSDLVLTQTQAMDFGVVKAGVAGATYTLATNNGLTPANGGVAEGGTPHAGHYGVNGSALINISVGNEIAGANGAVLSSPVCNYNGAGDVAGCVIGGATNGGHTLDVGFTLTTTAAGLDGLTDSPSFDLTVTYQ